MSETKNPEGGSRLAYLPTLKHTVKIELSRDILYTGVAHSNYSEGVDWDDFENNNADGKSK